MTFDQLVAVRDHEHTEGPWGIVFANIRKLPEPIPCRGAQGLWNVPEQIQQQIEAMLGLEVARA
jgi:hypothetical protein